ncbi:uncharacterized protein LOC132759391 [Ruditapes philippinarum]|uniref:uncharacterized protein LOC132759391 n=1 Tax=Ruditapes philippinarum TaxID=129788 RepID=UPI00295BD737|nr:uncharacterized protein LOC132759391 [Ruditapes philippinarum]
MPGSSSDINFDIQDISSSQEVKQEVQASQPSHNQVQYVAETPSLIQVTQEVQAPSPIQYVDETPSRQLQVGSQSDVLSTFEQAGTPTVALRSRLCIVCFDREPTSYYFPCGHTSCLPCALHLFENTTAKKCPTCRQTINSIRNIYNDI